MAGIVKPTTVPLPSFAEISATEDLAWVTVGGAVLFRSKDRGERWEQRGLPPSALTLESLSFVDDREGWLAYLGAPSGSECGIQPVQLWHTGDAGATYAVAPANGIADQGCKGPISFVDESRGFLGAWRSDSGATMYRTNDGGASWTGAALVAPPSARGARLELGTVSAFGTVLLVDALVSGMAQQAHVAYRSTDGGASWTLVGDGLFDGPITFVTATRWLQLRAGADSLQTLDGGKTWRPLATDYQQAAPIAPVTVFADPLVGYATVRGEIKRTVDGGAHWARIRTPGT